MQMIMEAAKKQIDELLAEKDMVKKNIQLPEAVLDFRWIGFV